MQFDTLFKKASNGKLQFWSLVVEGNGGYETAFYYSRRGYIGGKVTESKSTIIRVGKNIGKANETTPYTQAMLDAQSKWKKKLDKGYFQTIEDAAINLVIRPMLAQVFDKAKHHITYPAGVMRKLDGTRGLGNKTSLTSRTGKEYPHLAHIRKELSMLLSEGVYIDGELYSHTIPFQEIVGLVMRQTLKPGDEERLLEIKLRAYDYFDINNLDMPFMERYKKLSELVFKCKYIELVDLWIIDDESEIDGYHDKFVKEGYEGAMIRNLNSPYELNKRSKHLQKVKKFMDDEFEVVGYKEGKGNDSGTVVWRCKTINGKEFDVKPGGSRESRSRYFIQAEKYMGKMLTVKFFSYTDDGIPRIGSDARFKEDAIQQ